MPCTLRWITRRSVPCTCLTVLQCSTATTSCDANSFSFSFPFHSATFIAHNYLCIVLWARVQFDHLHSEDQQRDEFTNPSVVSCSSVSLIFNSCETESREEAEEKNHWARSILEIRFHFVSFAWWFRAKCVDYNQHMRRHRKRFRSFCLYSALCAPAYVLDLHEHGLAYAGQSVGHENFDT